MVEERTKKAWTLNPSFAATAVQVLCKQELSVGSTIIFIRIPIFMRGLNSFGRVSRCLMV